MAATKKKATEHTPGPWKVRREWMGHGYEVFPVLKEPVGQPSEVATVYEGYSECRANARLIAAAPDLLAVARLVKAARLAPNEWNLDAFDAAIAAAETAIVKATGVAA